MTMFGSVSIYAPGSPEIAGHRSKCERVAFAGGVIKTLSVVTTTQQAKAYRAVLCGGAGGADLRITVNAPEGMSPDPDAIPPDWDGTQFLRDEARYTSYVHKLAYGRAHMVFLSKDRTFMPTCSEEELYLRLYPPSQAYDIPLLDPWLPWIFRELQTCGLLVPCEGFGTESAMLKCDNAQLEEVVRRGVRDGHLGFPEEHRLQLVG